MAQSSYQEPIEKEDLDLAKKLKVSRGESDLSSGERAGSSEIVKDSKQFEVVEKIPNAEVGSAPEVPAIEKIPGFEKEAGGEAAVEQVSEKIETARKTIQTQKPTSHAAIHDDANAVAGIQEYEKKIEKLVELALQKGPEHAIQVAMHMDANDNYTLDELRDKMIADDLRKQLIQKGLLKEL